MAGVAGAGRRPHRPMHVPLIPPMSTTAMAALLVHSVHPVHPVLGAMMVLEAGSTQLVLARALIREVGVEVDAGLAGQVVVLVDTRMGMGSGVALSMGFVPMHIPCMRTRVMVLHITMQQRQGAALMAAMVREEALMHTSHSLQGVGHMQYMQHLVHTAMLHLSVVQGRMGGQWRVHGVAAVGAEG